MATIKDVAKLAGVSPATVSAAISGKGYIRDTTRQRVMRAVEQLGYAPDGVAQSLRRRTTHTLGLVVPDITNPFYTELTDAVERAARALGYAIVLCGSGHDAERERQLLQLLRTRRVDGIILAPFGTNDAYARVKPVVDGFPLVLVNNAPERLQADTIVIDNFVAGYKATRHILDQGHRRIATIAGPQHTLTGRERLRGVVEALAERDLQLEERYLRFGGFLQDEAHRACDALLALDEPPTAIFAANNHMVVGTMLSIARHGRACPDDISVAGVDDFRWAEAFRPRLTTIRQPVEAMGAEAVRLVLQRIDRYEGQRVQIVFEPELVCRESVTPPRAE